MKDADALATILLVSRLRSEGLEPLKASEYWKLCDQVGKPSALLGQAEERLRRDHGLRPGLADRVVALLDRATSIAFELERLDQSGITTLTPFDGHYPARFVARLGGKAPPVLHAAGQLDLLDRPGLGIVGSRNVGQKGADVAGAAVRAAGRCGIPVVSGGARGVDQLAMNAALDADGTVIGILADTLATTLRKTDIRRAIHDDQAVMCTPYGPMRRSAPATRWAATSSSMPSRCSPLSWQAMSSAAAHGRVPPRHCDAGTAGWESGEGRGKDPETRCSRTGGRQPSVHPIGSTSSWANPNQQHRASTVNRSPSSRSRRRTQRRKPRTALVTNETGRERQGRGVCTVQDAGEL